jgi:hypothetical protein
MLQIRDGLEDWEYMRLLRKWVNLAQRYDGATRNDELIKAAQKTLTIADEFIYDFTTVTETADDMLAGRAEVADMIEKLRSSLSGTQD